MRICFRNGYAAELWVAISFYSPDTCRDDGLWARRGWWSLDPEQKKCVVDTGNRYFYFYAESADGLVWAGPFATYVSPQPFDSCIDIANTTERIVGMRECDMNALAPGSSEHTLNLVR